MDIPVSMPTDNLYKFMAISGLVILCISFIFPLKLLNEYDLEAQKIGAEINILELESEYLLKDSKNLEGKTNETFEKVENLEKEVDKKLDKKRKLIENQKKHYKDIVQQQKDKLQLLIKMREEIQKRERLFKIKTREIENKTEIIKYLIAKIDRLKLIFALGIAIGTFLTYLGFQLWYIKLQVYQDMFIKHKAQKEK